MYDYATVTKQNQIINLIDTLNTNLLTISQTIYSALILLAVILCLIFISKLIITLMGGK